MKVCWF